MKELINKQFETKKELYNYLIENKKELIKQKKSAIKHTDSFNITLPVVNKKETNKEKTNKQEVNDDQVVVKVVINTTNLQDSYDDVHIKGIWEDSLKDNTRKLHLQEHKVSFDSIISEGEDLKVYVQDYTWKELGLNYEGETQALVFESTVKKERNPFMYTQYKQGFVKNHSVGMRYIELKLAINDPEYTDEFEIWKEYIDQVANKEYTESKGYFWAVTKASFSEGSAVVYGSNWATPTLSTESKEDKKEFKNKKQQKEEENTEPETVDNDEIVRENEILEMEMDLLRMNNL